MCWVRRKDLPPEVSIVFTPEAQKCIDDKEVVSVRVSRVWSVTVEGNVVTVNARKMGFFEWIIRKLFGCCSSDTILSKNLLDKINQAAGKPLNQPLGEGADRAPSPLPPSGEQQGPSIAPLGTPPASAPPQPSSSSGEPRTKLLERNIIRYLQGGGSEKCQAVCYKNSDESRSVDIVRDGVVIRALTFPEFEQRIKAGVYAFEPLPPPPMPVTGGRPLGASPMSPSMGMGIPPYSVPLAPPPPMVPPGIMPPSMLPLGHVHPSTHAMHRAVPPALPPPILWSHPPVGPSALLISASADLVSRLMGTILFKQSSASISWLDADEGLHSFKLNNSNLIFKIFDFHLKSPSQFSSTQINEFVGYIPRLKKAADQIHRLGLKVSIPATYFFTITPKILGERNPEVSQKIAEFFPHLPVTGLTIMVEDHEEGVVQSQGLDADMISDITTFIVQTGSTRLAKNLNFLKLRLESGRLSIEQVVDLRSMYQDLPADELLRFQSLTPQLQIRALNKQRSQDAAKGIEQLKARFATTGSDTSEVRAMKEKALGIIESRRKAAEDRIQLEVETYLTQAFPPPPSPMPLTSPPPMPFAQPMPAPPPHAIPPGMMPAPMGMPPRMMPTPTAMPAPTPTPAPIPLPSSHPLGPPPPYTQAMSPGSSSSSSASPPIQARIRAEGEPLMEESRPSDSRDIRVPVAELQALLPHLVFKSSVGSPPAELQWGGNTDLGSGWQEFKLKSHPHLVFRMFTHQLSTKGHEDLFEEHVQTKYCQNLRLGQSIIDQHNLHLLALPKTGEFSLSTDSLDQRLLGLNYPHLVGKKIMFIVEEQNRSPSVETALTDEFFTQLMCFVTYTGCSLLKKEPLRSPKLKTVGGKVSLDLVMNLKYIKQPPSPKMLEEHSGNYTEAEEMQRREDAAKAHSLLVNTCGRRHILNAEYAKHKRLIEGIS